MKDATVDMGAYEFDSTATLAVSENHQPAFELLVSPNPVDRLLKFTYHISETEPVYLSISDLNGKQLWSSYEGEQIKGDYELEINLSSFQKGVYFLNLETKDRKLTQRVVKN